MRKVLREFTAIHRGVILPFAVLPKPHQLAIAWYMSIDGAKWEDLGNMSNVKSHDELVIDFKKALPEYVKKYGKKKFGTLNIPMSVCQEIIMKSRSDLKDDFKTFMDYHKWYTSYQFNHLKYKNINVWPCILSDNLNEELFQDGWHRFHRYVQLKMLSIPCVYYP